MSALKPVTEVEGIAEYRLANGLQVLLAPDDSKPTTTVNVTYRVGSRHENYGETGMAHLLEHLIFKGTPTHPTVWAEFAKRGLRANGTHLGRPHQLLRQLRRQRTEPALVSRLAGRCDGQLVHRAQGPRHRDDRGAQRDGDGRERPRPHPVPEDHGGDVPVAQLRQVDHRRAQRRGERRHRPPAGVLPHLLPARQRHADRVGQVRRGQGEGLDRASRSAAFGQAQAHAAAALHARSGAGRRAQP